MAEGGRIRAPPISLRLLHPTDAAVPNAPPASADVREESIRAVAQRGLCGDGQGGAPTASRRVGGSTCRPGGEDGPTEQVQCNIRAVFRRYRAAASVAVPAG